VTSDDADRGTVTSKFRRRAVAVIPARGGSKGVPRKNLQHVGGVPLIQRAVRTASAAQEIDAVFVSTDHDEIADLALRAGAWVIDRPAELAQDASSSESVLLHALGAIESETGRPEVVVMIQATSPFIYAGDLDVAVTRVRDGEADCAFSATPTHAFLWRYGDHGAVSVNHDAAVRVRRQDLELQYRETGAFYAMDVEGFLAVRHRFFGRVEMQVVEERWAVDVDGPDDLQHARLIAPDFRDPAFPLPFSDARALVTDFDGVHTDDHAFIDETGRESVRVSRADGHGLGRLAAVGLPMLILSRERNAVVAARAEKLGMDVVHAVNDKVPALRAWAAKRAVDLRQVVYVGNDMNDVGCLEIVGWPVVVADAHPSTLPYARLRLSRLGGEGALREVAEMMLAALNERGEP
jgi:N-acylneuraminate cytidylyltransferase